MNNKFESLVWRAGVPDAHGDQIQAEALQMMAEELQVTHPEITFEFDFRKVVGRVVDARTEDGDLYVTAQIDPDIDVKEAAIRPGFRIMESHVDDEGCVIIDRVDMTHLSLTTNPMALPGDNNG